MGRLIDGLHHVTAISSSIQNNIDFYAGVLGLRLVKQTVNFDAPEVYHFYYGTETGAPSTLLTFFPYQGLINGRQGKGTASTTGFSADLAAMDYWLQRLKKFNIPYKKPQQRFPDEIVVYFEDEDGLGLELVFNEKDNRPGWNNTIIPKAYSIKGLYHVELWLDRAELTMNLFTDQLDHTVIRQSGNRTRLATADAPGHYIDLISTPESLKGLAGSGTVHHIALKATGPAAQETIRQRVIGRGLAPTPVKDRNYFTSVYFREPGGVLLEVATATPGFTTDEPPEALGMHLMLPPQFEHQRKHLTAILPPFKNNWSQFK
ncbi:diguanylate cyclase [Niabella ginsenosidivorans]|uniref:Diguanylate cyclase n=1 Tax=Niabella ginsenosidivorans TaxID=1176587 RepID=A0A1A9I565_9BACT|nr:VOC family protein [Niabella ginsenosidivorans]ANH82776.1 diguanylate cyclase [Niabella ginsenosidivorans]